MPKERRAAKKEEINVGEVAFLAGVLIAVISGLLTVVARLDEVLVVYVLLGLGVLVGLLNIRKEEYTTFLLASLVFLTPLQIQSLAGTEWLAKMIYFIGVFVLPAALITAFKAIWDTASKR
ncbi:MAG: hypothetical protein QW409_02025 [Candidatus Aenigmatarchaeota archaeon]